jgi:hypothetical protein
LRVFAGIHQEVLGLYKTRNNAVTSLILQFAAWALGGGGGLPDPAFYGP